MVIVQVDEAPVFTQTGALAYRLTLEGGGQRSGLAVHVGDGLVRIAPIDRHGYHNLLIGNSRLVVAVYPRRCPSVEAMTGRPPVRPWGVARSEEQTSELQSLMRTSYAVFGLQ